MVYSLLSSVCSCSALTHVNLCGLVDRPNTLTPYLMAIHIQILTLQPAQICCCIFPHAQALCRGMAVSAGARWWHSSLCTSLLDAPTLCADCWCSWPHFNDLNHLRSTATHFRGLTEFILIDRDQCPQPSTLPDYSSGRDLSDWHDWIQLSALILLLIPPLWLGPWGQMSGMEQCR